MRKNDIHHDEDRRRFIPLGAPMTRFEVVGTPIWTPTWNAESGRYDIQLLADIRVNLLERGYSVLIKAGFICDGASVPKRFWDSIGSPYASRYLLAAILHDALYQAEIFERPVCDAVFAEFMEDLGVVLWRREFMWIAVRVGGWIPWNAHTDESIAVAERHILLVKLNDIPAFPSPSGFPALSLSNGPRPARHSSLSVGGRDDVLSREGGRGRSALLQAAKPPHMSAVARKAKEDTAHLSAEASATADSWRHRE